MKYVSHLVNSTILTITMGVSMAADAKSPSHPKPVDPKSGNQTVDVVSSNLNKNYNDNDATAISGSQATGIGTGTAIIKDNSTTTATGTATLNDNSSTTQNVDLVDNSSTTQSVDLVDNSTTSQTVVDKSQTTQTVDSSGQQTSVNSSGQSTEVNDNSVTTFEAAAAGSSAYAAPVFVPSSCMSGWSFGASGAQVSGSGAFSISKVTPAGVDLNGLTLRDYLLIGEGEKPEVQQQKRADATKHLSEGDQERLTCLVAAIEEQEDIQAHALEIQKDNQDFQLFYLYAQHALKNDGPGATTTTIRHENGDVVTTIKETDEASIQEHAAITMAIAERNPELMLWIGAFSEVEIDGTKSATQIVRDYMKNEIDFDFKAEANKRIQNMFAPK